MSLCAFMQHGEWMRPSSDEFPLHLLDSRAPINSLCQSISTIIWNNNPQNEVRKAAWQPGSRLSFLMEDERDECVTEKHSPSVAIVPGANCVRMWLPVLGGQNSQTSQLCSSVGYLAVCWRLAVPIPTWRNLLKRLIISHHVCLWR